MVPGHIVEGRAKEERTQSLPLPSVVLIFGKLQEDILV